MLPIAMQRLRDSLPEQLPFHYFEGRLPLMILGWLGEPLELKALRASRWAPFLAREAGLAAVALARGRTLTRADLASVWLRPRSRSFWLTFGRWGGEEQVARRFEQTSRPGYNLVVQLNFARSHERHYRKLVKPKPGKQPFNGHNHPVSATHCTLAWSRVDVDLASRTALIEELQSDWVRRAAWGRRSLRRDCDASCAGLSRYHARLWPYTRLWPEAMLAATLQTLVEGLGARTVYLHTPESGARLKNIFDTLPPRSLYTSLPKRFGFEEVAEPPPFLADLRLTRRTDDLRMWRLRLDAPAPA